MCFEMDYVSSTSSSWYSACTTLWTTFDLLCVAYLLQASVRTICNHSSCDLVIFNYLRRWHSTDTCDIPHIHVSFRVWIFKCFKWLLCDLLHHRTCRDSNSKYNQCVSIRFTGFRTCIYMSRVDFVVLSMHLVALYL